MIFIYLFILKDWQIDLQVYAIFTSHVYTCKYCRYSNKQECGFIIKYHCTVESKFFFLLKNTEVFNPQSFLLLNPKFHSVKPSVSTCQSASFCQIPSFCQVKSFLLSIRKVVPVKPEFSSYQTRSFLLSNSKLPHFESRLSVKSKVSFLQFGNFFLTNLNFSPISPEVSVRPFNN